MKEYFLIKKFVDTIFTISFLTVSQSLNDDSIPWYLQCQAFSTSRGNLNHFRLGGHAFSLQSTVVDGSLQI
jgi:hypothetical protein